MPKRIHLFGIGSKAWQEKTGHTVNERGVPIPSHGPSPRKIKPIAPKPHILFRKRQ